MTLTANQALDWIVFQSNLLALGAALVMATVSNQRPEASTAAAELRNLAAAAKQAASRIKEPEV